MARLFVPNRYFRPADLPEIEDEFLDSVRDIKFDRENSALFPTDAKAADLDAKGYGHGGYSPAGSFTTVKGISPSLARQRVQSNLCDDQPSQMNPDLLRFWLGMHEGTHFLGDLKYKASFTNFVDRAKKELARKFPGQDISGIESRYWETIGDISAALYMLNKYPDDPAVKTFVRQLPGYSATKVRTESNWSYTYNNSQLLEKFGQDTGTPLNAYYPKNRQLTLADTTRMAITYMNDNFNAVIADSVRTLHEERLNANPLTKKISPNEKREVEKNDAQNKRFKTEICTPPR